MVGTKRFKFDVFSNDVNLANEMESTGIAGRVHISEVTASFLNDEYILEEGPEHCNMKTYFIAGRTKEDPDAPNPFESVDVEQLATPAESVGDSMARQLSIRNAKNSPSMSTIPATGSDHMKSTSLQAIHAELPPSGKTWSVAEKIGGKISMDLANGSSAGGSGRGSRSSGLQDASSDGHSIACLDTAISHHHNAASLTRFDADHFEGRLAQIIQNSEEPFTRNFFNSEEPFTRNFFVHKTSLNRWTLQFTQERLEEDYRAHFAESMHNSHSQQTSATGLLHMKVGPALPPLAFLDRPIADQRHRASSHEAHIRVGAGLSGGITDPLLGRARGHRRGRDPVRRHLHLRIRLHPHHLHGVHDLHGGRGHPTPGRAPAHRHSYADTTPSPAPLLEHVAPPPPPRPPADLSPSGHRLLQPPALPPPELCEHGRHPLPAPLLLRAPHHHLLPRQLLAAERLAQDARRRRHRSRPHRHHRLLPAAARALCRWATRHLQPEHPTGELAWLRLPLHLPRTDHRSAAGGDPGGLPQLPVRGGLPHVLLRRHAGAAGHGAHAAGPGPGRLAPHQHHPSTRRGKSQDEHEVLGEPRHHRRALRLHHQLERDVRGELRGRPRIPPRPQRGHRRL
uniref:adenylate cyclase n=1 Tax=Steinernema glaseri TaxID=37863 RepID=A0A1I8AA44_9BILA